jgi:hypothetical protein
MCAAVHIIARAFAMRGTAHVQLSLQAATAFSFVQSIYADFCSVIMHVSQIGVADQLTHTSLCLTDDLSFLCCV